MACSLTLDELFAIRRQLMMQYDATRRKFENEYNEVRDQLVSHAVREELLRKLDKKYEAENFARMCAHNDEVAELDVFIRLAQAEDARRSAAIRNPP